MNLRYSRLSAALVVAGLALSTRASGARYVPEWQKLDFKRTITQGDMVFVPLKHSGRGVFFYLDYAVDVTSAGGRFERERIVVSLKPRAQLDGRYDAFLRDHGVKDMRFLWLEPDGTTPICMVTEELSQLVSSSPYHVEFLPPSYPNLCDLLIVYPKVDEAKVLALAYAGKALRARALAPLCDPTSPSYEAEAVIAALREARVLEEGDSLNQYRGEPFAISQAAEDVFREGGGAFFNGDPEEGAAHFRRTFVRVLRKEEATVELEPFSDPTYVCKDAPLTIEFNQASGP